MTIAVAPLVYNAPLAMGFSPGPLEIILIVAALVLLFGRRLPEVGRSIGKGLVEFKKGVRGVEDELKQVDGQVEKGKRDQQERELRAKVEAETRSKIDMEARARLEEAQHAQMPHAASTPDGVGAASAASTEQGEAASKAAT